MENNYDLPNIFSSNDPKSQFSEFQMLANKCFSLFETFKSQDEKVQGFALWKQYLEKIQILVDVEVDNYEPESQSTGHTLTLLTTRQEMEMMGQNQISLIQEQVEEEQDKELTRATLDLEQEIRNLVTKEAESDITGGPSIVHVLELDPVVDIAVPTINIPLLPLQPSSSPTPLPLPGPGPDKLLEDDDKALESVVEDVIGLEEEKNRKQHLENAQQVQAQNAAPGEVPNPSVPAPIICTICTASFKNSKELEAHKETTHKKLKHFKCTRCPCSFSTKGNLNVHIRSHTGEKPFACTKCSARFSISGNLRRHLLSHQGLKPYRCPICENTFTEKKSLQIHTRTHTGEKPFKCPHCPKQFIQKAVLHSHLSLHLHSTSTKPFPCDKCKASFAQKTQLNRHNNYVHIKSKSYTCSNCDGTFVTKADLKRHEKAHDGSGSRSFICEICGLKFMRKYNLKIHINQKHPATTTGSDISSKSNNKSK